MFDGILADPKEGGQTVVYHKGKKVVDLYGGPMDITETVPCGPTTLSQIFSATKGAGALMVAMLVQEGKIDLDVPVIKYWPEFGQNGKEKITVREACSHRAGLYTNDVSAMPSGWLCAVKSVDPRPLSSSSHRLSLSLQCTLYERRDFLRNLQVIEKQKPVPPQPGFNTSYHAFTIGAASESSPAGVSWMKKIYISHPLCRTHSRRARVQDYRRVAQRVLPGAHRGATGPRLLHRLPTTHGALACDCLSYQAAGESACEA